MRNKITISIGSSVKSVFVCGLFSMVGLSAGVAQIPPSSGDPHWVLQTGQSDEFNGSSLDGVKWDELYPEGGVGFHWGGGQLFRPANVSVSGGNLVLELGPYTSLAGGRYWSGGIRSVSPNYGPGYAEWYSKLPGYDDGGSPYCEGMWPALWAYYEEYDPCVHDEIDVMDPGWAYHNTDDCGIVKSAVRDCNALNPLIEPHFEDVGEPLYDEYHKYAYEWLGEGLLAFYFDDELYYLGRDVSAFDMHDLYQVAGFQMDGCCIPDPADIDLPVYMYVDYFRYYKLNLDCSNSASLLNQTQYDSYVPQVKQEIIIGNGSTSIACGDNDFFRFTDGLWINGPYTVSVGDELTIIPTPCE